jgi:ABC-type bacteriocin/lantibiotic exporter with double-glycine peptidase domain
MANSYSTQGKIAVRRILDILKLEKSEISNIYFYAILSGLIQLIVPVGVQAIINFLQAMQYSTSLVILIVLVIIGVFIYGVMQINQVKIIEKIQQQLFVRYSYQLSHRFPKLDLKAVDEFYLPELANRFFEIVSLQKNIAKLLLDVPAAIIQILFGVLLLSVFTPTFILFGAILIIILYLILYYTGSRGLESSLRESTYKYKVAGWLEEVARMVRSFKFSRGSELNIKKTDQYVSHYLEARTEHFKVLLFQQWAFILFKTLITAAMLILGSMLFIKNQINLGQFVAAEIVILTVINSVEKIIISLENVYDILTSVEKIGNVLDKPLEPDGNYQMPAHKKGMELKFENVSFSYPNHTAVLSALSFEVKPAEKICIYGEEGVGKSTLLRLLSGSFRDFSGAVTINGVPLNNYHMPSLRSRMGILLEHQDVFNGSLLENISMGDTSISLQQVVELSELVGLKDFVATLKNGYDTELDPTGKRLSKNVVQKILLMRALVGQPQLLLLEDPLHGLDASSKERLKNYLLHQLPHTTVLMTGYDETLLNECDKVLYMTMERTAVVGTWADIKKQFRA